MRLTLFLFFVFSSTFLFAQESDVIIMKNKKGKTVKVLGEGIFIKGVSVQGNELNGYIQKIKNDSIFVQHGVTKLVAMDMGTKIDTFFYTQKHHYLDLDKLDLKATSQFGGRKRGTVFVENLMAIGSIGYILLETVNGLRTKQSFNSNNRLESMGYAAGVYLASRGLKKIRLAKNNVRKYQFEYIPAEKVPELLRPNKDN